MIEMRFRAHGVTCFTSGPITLIDNPKRIGDVEVLSMLPGGGWHGPCPLLEEVRQGRGPVPLPRLLSPLLLFLDGLFDLGKWSIMCDTSVGSGTNPKLSKSHHREG